MFLRADHSYYTLQRLHASIMFPRVRGGGACWTGVSLNCKACSEPRQQFLMFAYISLYSGPRWLSAFGEKGVHIVKGHYVRRGCTCRPLLSPWVCLPPSGERADWTQPQLWGPLASEVFLGEGAQSKASQKVSVFFEAPLVFSVNLNICCWEFNCDLTDILFLSTSKQIQTPE